MPLEVFIDESLRRDYVIAAVMVDPGELKAARSAVRATLLSGERRIHFSNERDARRRELLARFAAVGLSVTLYVTRTGAAARQRLLTALVEDVGGDLHRLVLESRADGDVEDQGHLIDLQRAGSLSGAATYEHLAPSGEEPLLWVADGAAWAWGAGTDWRRRVAPLLAGVRRIDP